MELEALIESSWTLPLKMGHRFERILTSFSVESMQRAQSGKRSVGKTNLTRDLRSTE